MTQPPTPHADRALSGRQIARAAGLWVGGYLLSRILGLVRDALLAGLFGGGFEFDAYAAASRPPETLFFIVAGGALGSAFIPTLTGYLERDDEPGGWRMTSAVITLTTLLMAVLAALAAIFARSIVSVALAPDFPPAQQALTASLMRVMLGSTVVFSISGLVMGVLNAHQRFLLPALAPAFYNLGIILGAVFLSPSIGIFGPAYGVLLGALLHLLVQIPGLFSLRMPFRPSVDVRNPGVQTVIRLMGPRVLGLSIVQVNFWVNTNLASGMPEGSLAALTRAWVLLLLPQGVIAQSAANAVFPTFSIHAARGEREKLNETFGQVLRVVLFLAIPATVGLVVLRVPLVRLLFERGAFTPEDTRATAWALLFYGLGLVAHSLVEVVTRAFYALSDTRTPVGVGVVTMALNVALSLLLIRVVGQPGSLVRGPFAGLALANTIATTLEGVLLLVLLRPRIGGLGGPRTLVSTLRASAAGAAMGALLWVLLPRLEAAGQIAGPLIAVAVGGAVFWGLAWLLGSEEARMLARLGLRRLRRA